MPAKKNLMITAVFICMFFIVFPTLIYASQFKVMVVMSYEEDFWWVKDIKAGIDSVLAKNSELTYFYMNTKVNLAGGTQKAEEAHALYQKLQPDGVITVDDNAQFMFVLPYLKGKIKKPLMFCGVNAEADKYGYPTSNISGILERYHFGESIAFAKQLIPSVKSFGFMIKAGPTADAIIQQIINEKNKYVANVVIPDRMPETIKDAIKIINELEAKCDVIDIEGVQGLLDEKGNTPPSDVVISELRKHINKPVISCGGKFLVETGAALCGVLKTGQDQGRTSAQMLLKAMKGTPVSDLPITQNRQGKRIINVTVMKQLGIPPKLNILAGVELVKTKK